MVEWQADKEEEEERERERERERDSTCKHLRHNALLITVLSLLQPGLLCVLQPPNGKLLGLGALQRLGYPCSGG